MVDFWVDGNVKDGNFPYDCIFLWSSSSLCPSYLISTSSYIRSDILHSLSAKKEMNGNGSNPKTAGLKENQTKFTLRILAFMIFYPPKNYGEFGKPVDGLEFRLHRRKDAENVHQQVFQVGIGILCVNNARGENMYFLRVKQIQRRYPKNTQCMVLLPTFG